MKRLIQETSVRSNTTTQDRRGNLIKLPAGTEVVSVNVSPDMENVWLVWKTETGTERGKIDMIAPYAMTYDWSNIIHDSTINPSTMTSTEKITLVNNLCVRMALDIGTKIAAGEVPENWDGHELRVLIADKAEDNASISSIRKEPRSARAKAYKNTILTTNIL